jgi:uncharacterized protein YbaA (DUF1428 family)
MLVGARGMGIPAISFAMATGWTRQSSHLLEMTRQFEPRDRDAERPIDDRISHRMSGFRRFAKAQQRGGCMSYIDGFVVPVPKKNLAAYRSLARKSGKVWLEHGALSYFEGVADDVKPGKVTSFPQSVKLKPGEVVVFSWIVYKSRAQRDAVNKKVMADPRLQGMMDLRAMPFDGKRMIYGGFKALVEL